MCIRRSRFAIVLAGLLPAAAALACGPDFPQQLLDDRRSSLFDLPDGTFYAEAGRLLPAPLDKLRAVEESPWDDADQARAKADALGLSADEAQKVKAMRAATDPDAAAKAGEGLAPELLEYTLGAIAFRKDDQPAAATHFRAVLDLPPPQRLRRGLWAQYMLGRSLVAGGDTAGASAAFAVVRERALSGIPDPQGLAVASLGEQGRIAWHHGAVVDAVKFYAQQAAHGSTGGSVSLLFVARSLLAHRDLLDKALDDPLSQRLLAAYLYARSDEFAQAWPLAGSPAADATSSGAADAAPADAAAGPPSSDAAAKPPAGIDVNAFLQVVQAHGLGHFDGADNLAAGAYRAGRYDLAGRLAAKSDSALAAWVRAKLALRAGDQATAMREYATAAKGFPVDARASSSGEDAAAVQHPSCRIETERGVLALGRGEYLDAMARMYAGASEYWPDAAYVGERVLTIDELKGFVDARAPAPPKKTPAKPGETQDSAPADQLRELLARRLMRAGRLAEALAYFDDPDLRKKAQALVDAHRDDRAWSASARAQALFLQAQITRRDGMELFGAELAPDNAGYGGAYDAADLPSLKDKLFVAAGESARVAASAVQPDARYHYRYVASNLAERAAGLVPPRSQAYAAMMCQATGWMLDTDRASAKRIYHRYLRNGAYVAWGADFGNSCPVPDFAAARWLPWRMVYHQGRHWTKREWPLLLGGLCVLVAAGFLLLRRRRAAA